MKRSEINQIMRNAIEITNKLKFSLPPFAYWTLEDWQTKGSECSEIIENDLGWDITDFGGDNFPEYGLILFTIRNGKFGDTSPHRKPYCEKLIIVQEGQNNPLHHHNSKIEDIINRGGGILEVQVYISTETNAKSSEPFEISMDGVKYQVQPGDVLELHPGESITLTQEHFHKFWAKKEHGPVLIGEASTVNDDYSDNVFYDEVSRFSDIIEDEGALYLLYNDYKTYVNLNKPK
jgi:D-lyxose ketol-isomerase